MYNVLYMKMGVYGVNCMKCKREIEPGQVFCPACLEEMAKYPVNPNTAVRLPRRPDPAQRRSQRRKALPEEEQIRSLRKRLWVTTWLFFICLALLIALAIPTVQHFVEDHAKLLPGQNYSSASQPLDSTD